MIEAFKTHEFGKGRIIYSADHVYACTITQAEGIEVEDGSCFVFVQAGYCHVKEFGALSKGMYAVLTNDVIDVMPGSKVLLIYDMRHHALRTFGGPVEKKGRLKYIDGCTDSLLISPVKKGDPCLNLLHFPRGIKQTMHTHPSVRIGVVYSGQGVCVTPYGTFDLKAGEAFVLQPEAEHCFHTTHSEMRIVAFHPDSDFGPTDEEHPMKNMTFVEGVSASKLESIGTK